MSLLRKYNIDFSGDRLNIATELKNIKPSELNDYLNNYYLLGIKEDFNDDNGLVLRTKIREYIDNYNLENVEILNVLENNIKEHLLSLKTIENKPNLTATLTTLKKKLSLFILGLQRLKEKNTSFLGGGKYKMHSKKEILGKMRCIYKKAGDRKDHREYIKHKGNFITLRKFREYNKQRK